MRTAENQDRVRRRIANPMPSSAKLKAPGAGMPPTAEPEKLDSERHAVSGALVTESMATLAPMAPELMTLRSKAKSSGPTEAEVPFGPTVTP